jgi:hypothetical protein
MKLKNEDGLELTNREDKAQIPWKAFKERMRFSDFTHVYFNLAELLQMTENLDDMVLPFSKEEIDRIIKNLPLGKSPGSDGFNTDFMMKCWGCHFH